MFSKNLQTKIHLITQTRDYLKKMCFRTIFIWDHWRIINKLFYASTYLICKRAVTNEEQELLEGDWSGVLLGHSKKMNFKTNERFAILNNCYDMYCFLVYNYLDLMTQSLKKCAADLLAILSKEAKILEVTLLDLLLQVVDRHTEMQQRKSK